MEKDDILKPLERHLSEFSYNSRKPYYNDSSDYTTNAPSYYDDLARKNKLIKHLALRIWDYDEELAKRFAEWDKKLEEFDDEVLKLLEKWMEDGTFDELINVRLFHDLKRKIPTVVNVAHYDDIDHALEKVDTILSEGLTPTLHFSGEKTYSTDKTVYVPSGVHLQMDNDLVYTGYKDEPIMVIGDQYSDNRIPFINVRVIRENVSNWNSKDNIGVKIYNAYEGHIVISKAVNNTVGVLFEAYSSGIVYNDIFLKNIGSNQYGVITDSLASGWFNENNIFGGRIWVDSSVHPGKSRYGVVIDSTDGSYPKNNNNNFYKPSFELKRPSGVESLPILINHGNLNKFMNCRNENNGTIFARFENESTENIIDVGYGFANKKDNSKYPNNSVKNRRDENLLNFNYEIFNSGILPLSIKDSISGSYEIDKMFFTTSNGNISLSIPSLNIENGLLVLPGSYGVAMRINTEQAKEFVTHVKSDDKGHRVTVKCYDENGLMQMQCENSLIKNSSLKSFYYTTNLGGGYTTTVSSLNTLISVHDSVKYIDVIITNCNISSFSIFSNINNVSVYNPLESERVNIGKKVFDDFNLFTEKDYIEKSVRRYSGNGFEYSFDQSGCYILSITTPQENKELSPVFFINYFSDSFNSYHSLSDVSPEFDISITGETVNVNYNGNAYYVITKLI